ncbi:hypothetical protein BDV38DRAFT_246117 [Aspergillus pseudotamarii]|uniref:Uncharacterized protein n=1 Tax=Aspergillus pseudotamarii TaxID=132259 RepID=A0A5N6SSW0_ASPPS|nr:uncharacterized protein BDV38DRAFT_246117 [Aspergillus pseudotamarii]KAE8137725.1 hypothetical protein BDV38DRAFT_246117 [Aspergillus pseudotamarii]
MAAAIEEPRLITRHPFARDPAVRLRGKSKPKGVQRARLKHRTIIEQQAAAEAEARHQAAIEQKTEPDLIDRFFALPSEVRSHVYRLLLVQPCKFSFNHTFQCKRFSYEYPGPAHTATGPESNMNFACADCRWYAWGRRLPVFVSPARSQWSPPMTNEYMCDNCYSENIRAKREPHPTLRNLKCLCARRQNLHIFLINKRFYEEASHVFWTENWFAFENPTILIDFLSCIRPQTRSLITKISFMIDPNEVGMNLDRKYVQQCWRLLWLCDGLMELELDQFFLSNVQWVLGMKNITPKRRIAFMKTPDRAEIAYLMTYDQRIWQGVSRRQLVRNILADTLAESMLRRRPMRAKALRALFDKHLRRENGEISTDED